MIPVDPAAFTMAASVTNTLSFLHHSHPGSVFYLFLVLYFLIFITQKTRGHSEDIKGVWKLIRTFSFTLISGSRSHHFRCQAPCSPRALLPSPSAISSPSLHTVYVVYNLCPLLKSERFLQRPASCFCLLTSHHKDFKVSLMSRFILVS